MGQTDMVSRGCFEAIGATGDLGRCALVVLTSLTLPCRYSTQVAGKEF